MFSVSLNGLSEKVAVSGAGGVWNITDVQVTLHLTGGYNGDLYAYLVHGDGFAVLLNRVGVGLAQGDAFGYGNAGMDITLATGGANGDIHWYGGATLPSGTYQPDGRLLDPLSVPNLFDGAPRNANLDSFTGLDPNGDWTLFIADVSAGGGQTTALSRGLVINAITPVPEPGDMALAALGLGLWGLRIALQKRTLRSRSQVPQAE